MKLTLLTLTAATALCGQTAQAPRDVFLLIGQSNMAGRGVVEGQDRVPIPRVFMLNKAMEWVPAVDPVHFDKPDIAGVGLARTFAKVLAAADQGATVGVIPAAFGGTSLDEWKAGGKLYEEAVRRAKFAMRTGKLRGILWHQGESDSGKKEDASSYRERFAVMINQMRAELGEPAAPVMVGQLGTFRSEGTTPRSPFAALVDEQLACIPLAVPHAAFVSSAGLTSNPDHLHFDARSQREFGRRYALAFLSLDATWPMR
jgi:Carbohydrate esterase, sialic acid-specific acetylesterase